MSRNIIIIGGTSGIGLATARYLNESNYNVVVAGRYKIEDEKEINYFHIDVTSESSINKFFSSIPFDHVDGVIYSAGATTNKKNIVDFEINTYLKVHDVNLLGAKLVLKYAYPLLKTSKGKVVIVSSFASRTYSQFSGFEYTVTKAGLSGLVKQLAVEWGSDQILINTIFPSMVKTPMLVENVDKDALKSIESTIPLGRIAKSEEISAVIEFLIGDRNTYITGAGIDVNGGQFLSG